MRRSWKRWLTLCLPLVLLALVRPVPAAAPYAGTWALKVLSGNQEINVWILKLEDKDGKPTVSVVAGLAQPFKDATVSHVSADGKALHFTLNARDTDFVITAQLPKDKTKNLYGTVQINDNIEPLFLESSEQTEIDQAKAAQPIPGMEDLNKAAREEDDKKRREDVQALIEKNAGKPLELFAAQRLAELEMTKGGSAAEIKAAVEQFIKAAAPYGPLMQENAAYQVTRGLIQLDKQPALALELARKTVSLLPESDASASRQVAALKLLASALKKAGKKEEVKEIDARLAELDQELDREFLKNAVPFKTESFAGRKGKSDRVAVVELFTGAQCPPCVSADIAFDAALKAYKPSDALFLQYHLHIPGPDPLTNSVTEARQEYYGDQIRGTPTMFLDGKTTPPMGGFRPHGKERYGKLSELINAALETEPGAQVKVTATRKGDKVDLAADVTDVKKPGDKVRLRFAVIEDVVRYPGRNGQRMHHHVVRAFPGGVEGFALKEKAAKPTASFSLSELEKSLNTYLEKKNFAEDDRPLKLEHLKVVAFVQDDESKEILQGAQAEIPEGKE